MRIELTRIELASDGLQGGELEFEPFLGVWTSFPAHRECQRVELAPVASAVPGELFETRAPFGALAVTTAASGAEAIGALRGDESVWLQLMAHTYPSGVEDLDKERGHDVKLTLQAGIAQVQLVRLLAACDPQTGTGTLRDQELQDPALLFATFVGAHDDSDDAKRYVGLNLVAKAIADAYADGTENAGATPHGGGAKRVLSPEQRQARAELRSHKAMAHVTFKILDCSPAEIEAARAIFARPVPSGGIAKSASTGALLYVPQNLAHFRETMDKFALAYVECFIGAVDKKSGEIAGPPKYPTPYEGLKNLHFAIYRTPIGAMLPVIAFWTHMAYQRPYATQGERELAIARYAFSKETEAYFVAMLDAACVRGGMSRAAFAQAIRAQHGQPLTHGAVSYDYRVVGEVVSDFATSVANAAYYMSDQRYANKQAPLDAGEAAGKPIGLESFDVVVLMILSKAADCEDQGNISSTVVRALSHGREDLLSKDPHGGATMGVARGWESDFLEAAREYALRRTTFDTGGDVTSAYLGGDGKKLEKKDIRALPLIGSPEDTRNRTGGHAWVLWAMQANAEMWLQAGGIHDRPLSNGRKYALWEYKAGVLTLEGTGPLARHDLRPAAEVYGPQALETRKEEAARALVRDTLAQDEFKEFTDAFRPHSQPFYTKTVEKERRITSFYLRPLHVGAAQIYEQHADLSQLTFIMRATGTRGVEISTLLRDGLDGKLENCKVALVAPFYGMQAPWRDEMVPMIEAVLNQMPVTSLGNVPRYAAVRPLHFGVVSQRSLDEKLASGILAVHAPLIGNVDAPHTALAASHGGSSRVAGVRGRVNNYPGPGGVGTRRQVVQPTITSGGARGLPRSSGRVRSFFGDSVQTGLSEAFGVSDTFGAELEELTAVCARHKTTLDSERTRALLPSISVDGIRVEAIDYIGEFDDGGTATAFNANTLIGATGEAEGWDLIRAHRTRSGRTERRSSARWLPRAHSVQRTEDGGLQIVLRVDCDAKAPLLPASSFTLLHVYVMGRVFALSPIVLDACGARSTRAQFGVTVARSSYVTSQPLDKAGLRDGLKLLLTLPTREHLALAFCTQEHIVAEPYLTREHNTPMGAFAGMFTSPSAAAAMLSFDFGALIDRSALSPFDDCYKRTDVVLVRFSGREWSLKRHEKGFRAGLDKLYASKMIVAHRYVVCSFLPQCDDVIGLDMLVAVPK
jgi:hypothetical protein